MTPGQQTALEALVGRALSVSEVEQIDGWLPTRRDDLIAGLLSTGRTRNVEIESWRAARYFIKRGKWQAILALADNVGHPARAAGQAARDLTSVAGTMVDLADPDEATQAMWAGLIAAGACTVADRDELQSWCREADPISERAVVLALNEVGA